MATDCGQWDTAGWKIAGFQWAFVTASCDCNDAAEGGSALKEGKEVVDEADAGVEV